MSARHQQTDGCLSSSPSSVRCLLLITILQKINNFVVDPVSVIRLAPFKRIHQNILSHSWVNAWWQTVQLLDQVGPSPNGVETERVSLPFAPLLPSLVSLRLILLRHGGKVENSQSFISDGVVIGPPSWCCCPWTDGKSSKVRIKTLGTINANVEQWLFNRINRIGGEEKRRIKMKERN